MLKLLDITKEYRIDEDSTLALHDIALEFRRSEFVSILGPSGCGKTTLLNIIGGLDEYTNGDLQIDGVSTKDFDDVDWDTYRNRRIGFVFQSYNLIPHMSVLKNVSLCMTFAGVGKEERIARAMEALEKVGLASQARKRPNQLSGGQMQRVAIARALVNNPDIILADEPTGALDSESGQQVMELLKEVARDRLVIMVTHNPALAEEYSTRIVYLKDGEVVGDTMPYDSEAELLLSAEHAEAKEGEAQAGPKKQQSKPGFFERLKIKRQKIRDKEKSSMKVRTAISLSWNNLLSKKGRTFLTSTAGSIGIIGILLVLSLSTGVSAYIRTIEENALSQYPISIQRTSLDLNSALDMLAGQNSSRPEFPDTDTIYTNKVLGNLLKAMADGKLSSDNDLEALKAYTDKNFDKSLGIVKYNYGTTFNVYAPDPKNTESADYIKINPYTEVMDAILDTMGGIFDNIGPEFQGMITQFANTMNSWDEISTNQQLLDQQYELVGDSRWPQTAEELVIVVDERNQLNDYALFMLGLKSPDDILGALLDPNFGETKYSVEQLLDIEYQVMTNSAYFYEDAENAGTYLSVDKKKSKAPKDYVDANKTETLKVVGVIRPKSGAVVTSINGVIGYTHALTEKLIDAANNHDAVKAQMAAQEAAERDGKFAPYRSKVELTYAKTSAVGNASIVDIEVGTLIENIEQHEEILLQMGVADLDKPQSILFYCASFESKDQIIAFLDRFTRDTGNEINYTDYLEMIMGYVGTLTSTVTKVLVGFAAISLLVSTIMIAIIIYTSVLERRKEIGVLRSIGARKKDISRVFIAESGILGAYSGVIGLFFSFLLSLVGNAVIALFFPAGNLIQIGWWQCLMMLLISIVLSIFAGFIPSRIAAKKDPAIALRSE